MPVNKARCGRASTGSAAKKTPTPSGPGVQTSDGTANTGATLAPVKHPDWQGPGKVVGETTS